MNADGSPSPAGNPETQIDWQAIRRRLDNAHAELTQAAAADPEQTQRILKARAEALGRKPDQARADAPHLEVVEFVLAQERYAVESRFVRDVYSLEQLTPVPCTPAFVLGIVNLHSEILSVIDIKKFFELPEKGITDLDKVIVLDAGSMRFGILADVILGVRSLPADRIQPSLPTLTGIREAYLKGVTPERVVVLDAEALLTDPDIVVREQVSA